VLLSNALVQLQAHYHHYGEAASEKCLSQRLLGGGPVLGWEHLCDHIFGQPEHFLVKTNH
jgi:hypothetical protein